MATNTSSIPVNRLANAHGAPRARRGHAFLQPGTGFARGQGP
ncbi:hypothetical protein H0B42_12620 [Rhodococcus aetherivorans]|nr:hypothetical protein [Rhodococcus aetherivorans]